MVLDIALGVWLGFVLISATTWAFCQVVNLLNDRNSTVARFIRRRHWA